MDLYIQLRIIDIIRETPDTFTYKFEVADNNAAIKAALENTDVNIGFKVPGNDTNAQQDPFISRIVPYKAGQFLTFLITLHGREYRRSYSLCSTPGIDPFMAVTVKRIANGEISRHIHHDWKVGDVVKSLLPSGRFTLDSMPDLQRDIFLLGAGSGITPLFSILKEALHRETSAHITLIYSNRNERSTIFYEQINELHQRFADRFTIVWLFSDPVHVTGHYRRMNNTLLEMIAPKHLKFGREKAQFFICGPSPYMRTVQFTLTFMGFHSAQLHKENFVVDTDAKLARVTIPQDSSEKQVTLKHLGKETIFKVLGNETILHAALRQGIELPYSCQGGVCGSCIARCAEGKVWMSVNEVLTDRELSQGVVLTCTGYAQSDVTLIW